MRETILEVNQTEFMNNVKKIKDYSGNKIIMPVVKANAYGTYLNYRLDLMNQFEIVCVATVDEAIYMRRMGFTKDILILNQPAKNEIPEIRNYNLVVGICNKDFLNEAINFGKKIRIHLELETGMNRTGIKENDIDSFLDMINSSNIAVEGIYTHYSSADIDGDYTSRQLEIFKRGVKKINDRIGMVKYIHTSASAGILHMKDDITNAIRPGLLLYGYYPNPNENELIDVKPICRLKARISHIFEIEEGEYVGYGKNYKAERKTNVAIVSIGYADGLRRSLSNKGTVIINGQKAQIIGNVCMDSIMVDITDAIKYTQIFEGDEAYIWDNENVLLEDIAVECGTINYEILSTISSRVLRKYIV